jgi:molecular chaperone HtpG
LRDSVKDVTAGFRLTDAPACITVGKDDPSLRIQRMFKAFGHANTPDAKPVLEINPSHPIIMKLEKIEDIKVFEETARIILDQALIADGAKLVDPVSFAHRISKLLEKAL